MKALKFFFLAWLDSFLNAFSRRICSSCRKKAASDFSRFFCSFCEEKIFALWKKPDKTRKYLAYTLNEINLFWRDLEFYYPKIYFALEYNEQTKFLIRKFKYHRPHYSKDLARILFSYWNHHASYILADIKEEELLRYPAINKSERKLQFFVTAIPLYSGKLESRTYNQADLLAKEFVKLANQYLKMDSCEFLYQSSFGLYYNQVADFCYLPNLLKRKKSTPTLFDKSKLERMSIMEDAFSLNVSPCLDFSYENILLVIDDISTTGVTFLEAYRALLNTTSFDEILFLSLAGRNFS